MKAETANRLTNSLTFAAQGKPQLPAGWVAPNQMESPSQKSNPVLSSIPPITSPALTGRIGRAIGIVRFSEQATEGGAEGLRWVGVERGQAAAILLRSLRIPEPNPRNATYPEPPARNCLLVRNFKLVEEPRGCGVIVIRRSSRGAARRTICYKILFSFQVKKQSLVRAWLVVCSCLGKVRVVPLTFEKSEG